MPLRYSAVGQARASRYGHFGAIGTPTKNLEGQQLLGLLLKFLALPQESAAAEAAL